MASERSTALSKKFDGPPGNPDLAQESAWIAIFPIEGVLAPGDTPLGNAEVRAFVVEGLSEDHAVATGRLSVTVPADVSTRIIRNGRYDHVVVNVNCELLERYAEGEFRCTAQVGRRFSEKVFFSTFRRAHSFFIPLWLLTELGSGDAITLSIDAPVGIDLGPESIPLHVRAFACEKDTIEHSIEEKIVFVFSSARSGSTWVASDILGWRHARRLIDEPGIGQCFAPLRWDAERFHHLASVPYMESGLDYEERVKTRSSEHKTELPVAPFARFNGESIFR